MGVVSQLWGTLLLSFFMQILDNSTTPNLWWYSLKQLEEDNSRKQLRYSKNPCLVQVKSIYPICPLHPTSYHISIFLSSNIIMTPTKVVDVHTHMYPPSYISLLQSRSTVPRIHSSPSGDRLIILSTDDDSSLSPSARGRPIGPEYSSLSHKLSFMDTHHIDISVISLANPWLDFLPAGEAAAAARRINDDMNEQCTIYPGRLFAFGTLPLSGSVEDVVDEIRRLKDLKYMRGVIMGTSGLGQGLDDIKLEPVWAALQEQKQMVFIHPHYGLPNEVYGPRAGEYGHVLSLALGFPMETTIAVTRMLVSGVWDRHTQLNVLLAHSGGTLPFLAGRIESCMLHDGRLKQDGKLQGRRTVWDVLKTNVYLDAVVYGEAGLKAAIEVSGADRLMFG